MPVWFDNAIDAPLFFDGSGSFLGGQVSNTRANLLKQDQYAEGINVDLSPTGQVSTRRGSKRLGDGVAGGTGALYPTDYVQGLTHYETPTDNFPIAVTGGAVWKFDGTNWVASGAMYVGPDGHTHVYLVQGVRRIYFADGVTNLLSWDGTTTVNLGGATNAHPPPTPYIICWHASRLVAVGTTDPDAIYFSQFLDGATWDRAKWSLKVGNTGGGTTGGFPAGTNDPITGLCSWMDFNLIVFKRKSIWVVDCNPSLQVNDTNNTIAGFTEKPIHLNIGCVAPRSAAQCGSDVWFLSTSGVRSVNRTLAAETRTEVGVSLSDPVQDIIDRINLTSVSKAVGFFWNNRYFLGLPLDDATENNYLLVYNFLTQSWLGLWTGWNVTDFARRSDSAGSSHMIFGQSDGTVFEWLDDIQVSAEDDTTYQDEGVDIPVTFVSRAMTANEPISPKSGLNTEFEFNKSLALARLDLILDDGGTQSIAIVKTSAEDNPVLPVTLPFTLGAQGLARRAYDLMAYGPWRELQFLVTTARQKLVLRGFAISGFTETMILQNTA